MISLPAEEDGPKKSKQTRKAHVGSYKLICMNIPEDQIVFTVY